ncbi:hypothetical protein B0T10DRAFT_316415 [Thelonectria olida]|uniref:Uncharacterized protein n=1 Tax=Thelonectria olida TaxID=1576542 RepID=A0A9P8W5F6_9HYPO|nr:hypothetical protein B0T10DRAFT_316415 [Thelonectria olida]
MLGSALAGPYLGSFLPLRTYLRTNTYMCLRGRACQSGASCLYNSPCPPLGANKGVPTLRMEERHHVTINLQVLDRQLKAAPHFCPSVTKYLVRTLPSYLPQGTLPYEYVQLGSSGLLWVLFLPDPAAALAGQVRLLPSFFLSFFPITTTGCCYLTSLPFPNLSHTTFLQHHQSGDCDFLRLFLALSSSPFSSLLSFPSASYRFLLRTRPFRLPCPFSFPSQFFFSFPLLLALALALALAPSPPSILPSSVLFGVGSIVTLGSQGSGVSYLNGDSIFISKASVDPPPCLSRVDSNRYSFGLQLDIRLESRHLFALRLSLLALQKNKKTIYWLLLS